MIALLLACAAPSADSASADAADRCGELDWYTVGAPFALTWCASCHAAGLEGAARHGAPAGIDLATLEGVRAQASASRRRIEAGTMPPAGGPSEVDVARFLDWLECDSGANSADIVHFPAATRPESAIRGAWEVAHEVTIEADFLEGLTVTATQLGQGSTTGLATLSIERYILTNTEAWLVERERYAEDGSPVFVDTWEPPLHVLADRDSWVARSTRTHTTPDASPSHDETWSFTRGPDPDADPRLSDPMAQFVRGLEDATGAEMAFSLSSSRGLDARRFADVGEFVDPDGAVFDVRLLGALPFPGGLPAFPLAAGQQWNAFLLQWDPL